MSKKSQAATEYLIVIAVVIIIALIVIGVLHLAKFNPDLHECLSYCDDKIIVNDNDGIISKELAKHCGIKMGRLNPRLPYLPSDADFIVLSIYGDKYYKNSEEHICWDWRAKTKCELDPEDKDCICEEKEKSLAELYFEFDKVLLKYIPQEIPTDLYEAHRLFIDKLPMTKGKCIKAREKTECEKTDCIIINPEPITIVEEYEGEFYYCFDAVYDSGETCLPYTDEIRELVIYSKDYGNEIKEYRVCNREGYCPITVNKNVK